MGAGTLPDSDLPSVPRLATGGPTHPSNTKTRARAPEQLGHPTSRPQVRVARVGPWPSRWVLHPQGHLNSKEAAPIHTGHSAPAQIQHWPHCPQGHRPGPQSQPHYPGPEGPCCVPHPKRSFSVTRTPESQFTVFPALTPELRARPPPCASCESGFSAIPSLRAEGQDKWPEPRDILRAI